MDRKDARDGTKYLEAEVVARLQQQWGGFTQVLKQQIGALELEYQKKVKQRGFSIALFIFGLFSAFFIAGEDRSVVYTIFAYVSIYVILATSAYLFWDRNGVIKRFNIALNRKLYPKIFSILGAEGDYKQVAMSEALQVLKETELVTEPHNTNVIDDSFMAVYHNHSAVFYELDLSNVTGSGKNRRVKQIFKGYLASFELPKSLLGKTFISTDGDRSGFGHRNFWTRIVGKGALETELEWNDFESLLHVASTDPSEARYVLTPEFMSELYDWWKDKKQNIRISFIGNKMNILFPSNDIQFNRTVSKLETEVLQEYAQTIAIPAAHILRLVDDIHD